MKILVLSDTHGDVSGCQKIKDKVTGIDLIVHLGDYSRDISDVKKIFDLDIINVKGNCDISDGLTKEEKVIEMEGKKIFLCHGHMYGVKRNLNSIYYRAMELNADAALFGHSHVPVSVTYNDILLFNPGSITLPRGGSKRSYGVIMMQNGRVESRIDSI